MKNILFVCTANICRSPFAEKAFEVLLKKKQGGLVKVDSAGVDAIPGIRSPLRAIQIAEELGVDLSGHTSRFLYPNMVEEADIILVMDVYHRDRILEISPGSSDRIRFLGSYGSACHSSIPEEMEIPDPYRLTLFHYRSSYSLIRDCVNNLYEEIKTCL